MPGPQGRPGRDVICVIFMVLKRLTRALISRCMYNFYPCKVQCCCGLINSPVSDRQFIGLDSGLAFFSSAE